MNKIYISLSTIMMLLSAIFSNAQNKFFDFSGNNDYLYTDSSISMPQGSSARTIEAWVRFNDVNSNQSIFEWGTQVTNQRCGLTFTNGTLYFTGENNDLQGTTFLQTNTWYHLAVTYNGSTLRLYVNGVQDAFQIMNLNTIGNDFRIGQNLNGGENFNGQVDEIRVWLYARTAAQLTRKMNTPLTGYELSLNNYYNFDQDFLPCGEQQNYYINNLVSPFSSSGRLLGQNTNMLIGGCSSNIVCNSSCGFNNITNFGACGISTYTPYPSPIYYTPDESSDLPCFGQGLSNQISFNLVHLGNLGNGELVPFTLTSITGLPTGLNITTNYGDLPQTVEFGELICFTVSGTTNDSSGDYPLLLTATVTLSDGNTDTINDMRSAASQTPYNITVYGNPTILGSNTVDAFSTSTYSVSQTANNVYNWSLTGGNIISGGNTNSITVQWGSAGTGTINLQSGDPSRCLANSTFNVNISCTTLPPAPTIDGNSTVNTNSNATYSSPNQAGFTYNWTVSGGSISSGQGTNSINVNWGTSSSGTVELTVTNTAGCTSSETTQNITIQAPPPPATWNTISSDASDDGANSNLLDGTKLEYKNITTSDSIYFRVTVTGFSLAQSQDLGVNILAQYSSSTDTFHFWGNDNHTEGWNRLLSTWVTGNAPSSYNGTIGISDAAGVHSNNYSSLSSNNISINVNASDNTIILGLKRSNLIPASQLSSQIRFAAAVGSSFSWNDDIWNPSGETIFLGDKEILSNSSQKLKIYPNPVQNQLNIKTDKPIDIIVANTLGEQVMEVKHTTFINVSQLPSGVYLISNKEHSFSAKFVKQ